jgi:hypothetical protein
MRLQRQSNGQLITLDSDSVLGVGGEACIYSIPQDPWLVAKVYHKPTAERARKLSVMVANPPHDPMASLGRVSIVWPVDLLCSADNKAEIAGFLMPLVTGMRSIFDFYNPSVRRECCPLFNYLYLHRAARNLAAAVAALHERGYVIGDVNESNIFVAETALVALVDTDSFQVCDPNNHDVYRCTVGKLEFTPPELQGKNFAEIDREPFHDLFGLAVLIFQLLMEGTHPFTGIFKGEGEPPLFAERISSRHFPYSGKRRVPYRPSLTAPPFEILYPDLRELFSRSFRIRLRKSYTRPDARMWQRTLDEAERDLITCPENDQHLYGSHLKTCPWCERSKQLGGRDPFPSLESVKAGQHLQPVPLTRTRVPPTVSTPQEADTAKPARVKRVWRWISSVLALLVFSFVALLVFRGNLPGWLSPIFSPALGPIALICGTAGWQRVKTLAGQRRWIRSIAIGIVTTVTAAWMLALLEIFILAGDRLYLTALLCETVMVPVALAYGALDWQRVKMLKQQWRWTTGAAVGAGTMAVILSVSLVAASLGERLPWWLPLACTAALIPAVAICGVMGWRRVERLRGYIRWMAGLALALGVAAAFLLLGASLITERLPRWLLVICSVATGMAAFISGAAGWRWVEMLARRGRWVRSVASGLGAAVVLVSMLELLETFMLAAGKVYLTVVICGASLGPIALLYGAVGWERIKELLKNGRWKTGVILAAGGSIVLALLFGAGFLILR